MALTPMDVMARLGTVPAFRGLVIRGQLVVRGKSATRVAVVATERRFAARAQALLESSGFSVTPVSGSVFEVVDVEVEASMAPSAPRPGGVDRDRRGTSASGVSHVLRRIPELSGAFSSGAVTVSGGPGESVRVTSRYADVLSEARSALAARGYGVRSRPGMLTVD